MEISGTAALVTGGASGLGEATTRALVERGARVAVADVNDDKANALAGELGDSVLALHCDVTAEDDVKKAVEDAVEAFGSIRFAVGCAGVGWPEKIVSKKGPHQLLPFETVVRVNLIGMFNFLRFAGKMELDRRPLDLNRLLEEMVDFFSPQAQLQKVQLRFRPAGAPLVAPVDERLLKQALLNLMINALHAMPNGGELKLHLENTTVEGSAPPGDYVVISVADTGVGMPPVF